MKNRLPPAFNISQERHEELAAEVVVAVQAGTETTAKMFAKYDAESCVIGMHYMATMANAVLQRKTTSVPKHPERN